MENIISRYRLIYKFNTLKLIIRKEHSVLSILLDVLFLLSNILLVKTYKKRRCKYINYSVILFFYCFKVLVIVIVYRYTNHIYKNLNRKGGS